jgi:hypothetical protein
MKLRSSVVLAVKAPPPGEILAPAERQPDSFDFLALPEEIRMCVYYLCLVSENEISIDEGHNAYHIVNYSNGNPSFDIIPAPVPVTQVRPTIQIKVPANFVYPRIMNKSVSFVPTATGPPPKAILSPQVIPLTNVVQPADLSRIPKTMVSAKTGFRSSAGIYIGPVHLSHFSYLPPCKHTPSLYFNANILLTCKTIYVEALPLLYSKNRFVIRYPSRGEYSLSLLTGNSLAHITELRLEVHRFYNIFDVGGSKSVWNTILRGGIRLRKLTLSFPDDEYSYVTRYALVIIRIAATIADVWKVNWGPVVIVRTIVEDPPGPNMILLNAGTTAQIRSSLRVKRHPRLPVPRGITTIELTGRMSLSDLRQIQTYSRNGWCFRRTSPEKETDIETGSWVELEWIINQS